MTGSSSHKPKGRPYSAVTVAGDEHRFSVLLDGRPIRTPQKKPLALPTRALAEAVAAEWEAQGPKIDPRTMLLTKLANTAIDRVAPDRDRIITEIVQFASSDLVCYRAEAPEGLTGRQALHWDPVLAWAKATPGASFTVTRGIVHVAQPEAGLEAIRRHFTAQTDWSLTAIHNITTLLGSALLAAMIAGRSIAAEAAWLAGHVDEDWQIEQWGADEEAMARRAARRREFDTCVRFLDLSSS
jgi:chaperone required for assembly of F1-ATPase